MGHVFARTPSASTRRRLAVCATAAIAAASVAGCGPTHHAASAPPASAASSSQAQTATGTPSGSTTAPAANSGGGGGGSRPSCPSASAVSSVVGATYTGPQSQAGAGAGTTVCNYLAGGTTALTLTYYPAGTPLTTLTAGAGATSPISADGKEATNTSGQIDYVSRASQPSVIVDDHADAQGEAPTTLTQLLRLG
ncbi:MAG TPA: hypothetical protein VIJ96_15075 [Acidothermaceae bacterium]